MPADHQEPPRADLRERFIQALLARPAPDVKQQAWLRASMYCITCPHTAEELHMRRFAAVTAVSALVGCYMLFERQARMLRASLAPRLTRSAKRTDTTKISDAERTVRLP